MKLSTKIRYGSRAMVELAAHYGEGAIELKEIAKKEDISPKYLEQVIIPLRTAGLVKSVRGSKGGYSLARPPSEISLKEIIEVLEGPIRLVDCLADSKTCRKIQSCVTREIWNKATDAINRVFSSVTLAEMVNRRMQKERAAPPIYQI